MRALIIFLLAFPVLAADPTVGPPDNNDDDRYGDYNALRINSSGQISTTLLAGEDQTNDVIKTEAQYNVCIDDADIVCKSSAGFVHSVWCYGEDTAATAGSVRITNTTAAGGAETTEVWGADIPAAAFKTQGEVLDIIMDTGIVIDFTTTADVKCGVSYR